MIAKLLVIKGRVQGVGFRMTAAKEAHRLGDLQGWVQNLNSADVEVFVQGPKEKVEAFLAWCQKGPSAASVQDIQITDAGYQTGLTDFFIKKS